MSGVVFLITAVGVPFGSTFATYYLALLLGLVGGFLLFADALGTVAPTVHARSGILPLPTLAYSDDFGLERFGFAIGLIVPPAAALRWPTELNGAPAPQRFSILSTDDAAVVSLALGAAYRPLERLSLGVALYVTFARVGGEVAISASAGGTGRRGPRSRCRAKAPRWARARSTRSSSTAGRRRSC